MMAAVQRRTGPYNVGYFGLDPWLPFMTDISLIFILSGSLSVVGYPSLTGSYLTEIYLIEQYLGSIVEGFT